MELCKSLYLYPLWFRRRRENLVPFIIIITGDSCIFVPRVRTRLPIVSEMRSSLLPSMYRGHLWVPYLLLNNRHYGTNLPKSCAFCHHHPSLLKRKYVNKLLYPIWFTSFTHAHLRIECTKLDWDFETVLMAPFDSF